MKSIIVASFGLFLLVLGCRVAEPLPDVPNTDYSIIDGDTVKTVVFKDYKKLKDKDPNGKNYIVVGDTIVTYREPKLHTPPAKAPDLSKLKNNDDPDLKGKPLRMVAIGGSLTAGVRDGGYFNEGILTSYPNLIARQMRLSKFEQPLFDADSYNGFGRKARTDFNPTGGPVPKFNEVKNNSGVEYLDDKVVKLKPYKVKNVIDNFAIPYLSRAAYKGNFGNLSDFSKKGKEEFYSRIIEDEKKEPLWKKVVSQKSDIAIVELRQSELISNLLAGNDVIGVVAEEFEVMKQPPYDPSSTAFLNSELFLLRKLEEQKGLKVVLINIPNFLRLNYFQLINENKLKSSLGNQLIYVGNTPMDFNRAILLPTSTVDSLLSSKVHISLKKGIFGNPPLRGGIDTKNTEAFYKSIENFNEEIKLFSKRFNYPIADIKALYDSVFESKYISHDGIKISILDFLSSDNINSSPLGQAVIANEVIKTINATYKTEIPLIKTSEYLGVK